MTYRDRAAESETASAVDPDCVGPITIPHELMLMLHRLADAAAVDDFIPLWICATELVRRWSSERRPVTAQLIRGARVAVAEPSAAAPAGSFRAALRHSAGALANSANPAESADRPVDVTILVSRDGDRLYIERMTSADDPNPQAWAQSFLQLLRALTDRPDAPILAGPFGSPAAERTGACGDLPAAV